MTELYSDRETIAIIGMSCRFSGADTPEAFWANLRDGVETLSTFTEEQLRATGIPEQLYRHPNYVNKRGTIADYDRFDAEFFGYSEEDAVYIDPQQRLLLACAYEAMEDAGQFADKSAETTSDIATGVFTSLRTSTYTGVLAPVLIPQGTVKSLQAILGNAVDQGSMRIAYCLDLTGPCINVQTACSSSLVAVHLACESLQSGECDMTLAGASALFVPQNHGYLYEEGALLAPDGRCRAFDLRAGGVVPGSGAGIVVLKRLRDALANRDQIHAVIRGTAVNNSGMARVDYRSPSPEGQAAVIGEAMAMAGVDPRTVSYVEANGTGTFIGDSIEIESLARAFGGTSEAPYCGIGSVKTNIGHLTQAAGIAGLIKTILALKHGELPPSLHYETPNPQLQGTPFYVVDRLRPWPESSGHPRRAGVNAFAIGGTNAHVVLEEAPKPEEPTALETPPESGCRLLTLSAKSTAALAQLIEKYRHFLATHPEAAFADICWTSNVGRPHYRHRLALAAADHKALAIALDTAVPLSAEENTRLTQAEHPTFFLFSDRVADQGYRLFHAAHPGFGAVIDACQPLFAHLTSLSLHAVLAGESAVHDELARQCLAYVVQRGLAALWISWGVRPDAVAGCGIGRFTASCLAAGIVPEQGLELLARSPEDEFDSIDVRQTGISLLGPDGRAEEPRPDRRFELPGRETASPGAELAGLIQQQAGCFVEIGAASSCFAPWKTSVVHRGLWLAAPGPNEEPQGHTVRALARYYEAGADVDWLGYGAGSGGRRISLPTYPFAGKICWFGLRDGSTPASLHKK
ncbi:MAG: type I polyketide synthase [Desulfobulbus sp.]|uniref:type I polyketide synthase n=1 Tax=Desulfobulbus sp. TaxID=895 RepID=UPI00283E56AD|nr:type I polyketide synthase [Desulfobulbus sp.]MDR2549248.1 type I polyketide synthase [Desulfobulbus sp.]